MSELGNEPTPEEAPKAKTYTQEEFDTEIAGLKSKVDELLAEKKAASKKADDAKAEKAALEEKQAREKGEFKTLYEQEQQKLADAQSELANYKAQVIEKEISGASLSVAATLTKDQGKQAILQEQVSKYIAVGDDGNLQYEIGGVAIEQSQLIDKIKTDFPFLIDGSPASGDRVDASKRKGGGATNTKQFREMNMAEKKAYLESRTT
jgi:hypothetical protein